MATALTYAANDTVVPEWTLTRLFFEAVDRWGTRTAYQRFESADRIVDINYQEVLAAVRQVSCGLTARGIEAGDRVAILGENRPEWAFCDYGGLCSGIIVVPIYPTLTAAQVQYILEDSGVKLVFASTPDLVEKAAEAVSALDRDIDIVGFDVPTSDGVIGWSDFMEEGEKLAAGSDAVAWRERALAIDPHDVATVLYTSGTTGAPKGVMLTHNNVASNVRASVMVLAISDADNTVSFLPLSHILQRMVDFLFFSVCCRVGYVRSMDTLIDDLGKLAPTVVVSVPRVYEKIYNGVMAASGLKKKLIDWSAAVAESCVELRLAGQKPSGLLGLKYAIADRLVFSKVKNRVGGRLRFFVSGGGPLAPALNRFFYSIGMTILEGYGLTETSPVVNVNTQDEFRIGTVGPPLPGTEVRIADDGEILVRGPQVMKGYYENPEATAAAIDAEGWFATGDIGEIDPDTYLRITDRKKDILVTAGGKNVAPQPVENRLKTHPVVEQAVMVGDRRRYCSLLVVPDHVALKKWAGDHGIPGDLPGLLTDPAVISKLEEELFAMLSDFASFERPKKLALLEEEFTVENGLMTPTLKVRRNVLRERFEDVIDALYAEEAADATAD